MISGERHEIAKRLRILASHAPADAELVNNLLGLYPGEYIDGYDPCNVQHLADLIEPKECTCQIKNRHCTNCNCEINNRAYFKKVVFDGGSWTNSCTANFCPNCGAKVVK